MADGLWWVPSLVVAGAALVALTAGVLGFRRLGVRREQAALAATRPVEVQAKALIVQADTAVREALAEVAFAEAQFDPSAARTAREAVESAQRRLREAFLLQQRLDDAEPDTAASRRTWSAHIIELCEQALRTIGEAEASLAARRDAERGASEAAPELRSRARELALHRAEVAAGLERLSRRFAASALGGATAALERADLALADAEIRLTDAAARLATGEPAAELTAAAAESLDRAARALVESAGVEVELAAAGDDEAASAARLEAALAEARLERDATDDGDAGAGLAAAVAEAAEALGSRASRAADPFAARDRLRIAGDRLEAARAGVRAARSRLDGARGALGGALAIAESQLRAADAAIAHGGRRVGVDARTRLAEAQRQLVIARQEPDPVAALDAARRATSRASDAEALAVYDAMGR